MKDCPECRAVYRGPPRRHRFAEKTAEKLGKLKAELSELQQVPGDGVAEQVGVGGGGDLL